MIFVGTHMVMKIIMPLPPPPQTVMKKMMWRWWMNRVHVLPFLHLIGEPPDVIYRRIWLNPRLRMENWRGMWISSNSWMGGMDQLLILRINYYKSIGCSKISRDGVMLQTSLKSFGTLQGAAWFMILAELVRKALTACGFPSENELTCDDQEGRFGFGMICSRWHHGMRSFWRQKIYLTWLQMKTTVRMRRIHYFYSYLFIAANVCCFDRAIVICPLNVSAKVDVSEALSRRGQCVRTQNRWLCTATNNLGNGREEGGSPEIFPNWPDFFPMENPPEILPKSSWLIPQSSRWSPINSQNMAGRKVLARIRYCFPNSSRKGCPNMAGRMWLARIRWTVNKILE